MDIDDNDDEAVFVSELLEQPKCMKNGELQPH